MDEVRAKIQLGVAKNGLLSLYSDAVWTLTPLKQHDVHDFTHSNYFSSLRQEVRDLSG